MSHTSNHDGSATILMMLMAGVILTVGLGFNWLVKEHIKAAEGLKNKVEAILKARSAYDTLVYSILSGRVLQKEIVLSGVQYLTELKTIPLNGKEVSLANDIYISVQDSNGRLSLVGIERSAMERLFKNVGQVENPSIPAESLLDWIDPDDLSRLNGAEKLYYQSQRTQYEPRNYALQYKEEIAFVRGIGRDLYAKVEPYLTALPSTGFNPNTASDETLKAYLNIDKESLNVLKDYLSKKPMSSNEALFFLIGRVLESPIDKNHFSPSQFVDVTVKVGSPRSLYTIKAGLELSNTLSVPFSVLYWQEE